MRLILIKQNEEFLERWRDALKPNIQSGEPNPPGTKVDSKIEKVDGTLVQISLGTDHGLKENNTLSVYRLKPEPKYLGMIRIVDARHHTSIGRLIFGGKVEDRPMMKEGDFVTSELPLKVELKKKLELPKAEDKKQGNKAEPPKGNDFPFGFSRASPPVEKLFGKIENVDAGKVRLSVGKIHGVAKDDLLDVYRLGLNPAYLGTIHIVEVTNTGSVGRFQPQSNQSMVKTGDLVTSKVK